MLRRSTWTVSGVVEVKRVVVVSGSDWGVGYGKYKCDASTKESVAFSAGSAGLHVSCGGFDAAIDARRRINASLFVILGDTPTTGRARRVCLSSRLSQSCRKVRGGIRLRSARLYTCLTVTLAAHRCNSTTLGE